MSDTRLRLVVFTSGPLTPVNRIFFERIVRDPLLELAAIVVDEYRRTPAALPVRVARAIREDGVDWLRFKAASMGRSMMETISIIVAGRIHGSRRREDYAAFTEATGVPVYRVKNIHDPQSIELIRSVKPDLGIIAGGRILRDSVITVPRHGTLNVHKRKVPDYRGGGPVGYWEVLAGEASIGVTIHFAAAVVDSGPVLGEATIPIEEFDTLESLKIKADIRAAQLYYDVLRRFALGQRTGVPQDLRRGTTYRAPSDYKVWRLQRQLLRRQTNGMQTAAQRPKALVRLRVLLQYIAVLPLLLRMRRRFEGQQRAPVAIFFYHLVANRALNHMCLPLGDFVRQIEFLRRHYEILSLDEAVTRLRTGANDRVAAALTFDDGYRDNTWAVEYLRFFGIAAAFFISIGHINDGSPFEHDRVKGFADAKPMTVADVQALARDGFIIAAHGVHHEDFGELSVDHAETILRESGDGIARVCGNRPEHFSFPKGQRGINITAPSFALAQQHFPYIYSAYGGYAFPRSGRRHFPRIGNPADATELGMLMTGYTGLRQCVTGNAWGLKIDDLDPSSLPRVRTAPIAAAG